MQAERVQVGYEGMNTNAAPDYIGRAEAALVENLLVDRDGRLPMRGPLRQRIDLTDGTNDYDNSGGAAWHFDDTVMLSYDTGGAVYKCRKTALPGGTMADIAASDFALDPAYDRLGDYVWGRYFNFGSMQYELLRWDGASGFLTYLTAPIDFTDVKAFQKRLFLLGGDLGGGVSLPGSVRNNILYYSDLGGPTTDLLGFWQDDVSGLTNQIGIDASPEEAPRGLAHAGKSLIIFMHRSIHVLTGSGPSSWVMRVLSTDIGCSGRGSIVEYEDGVLFASKGRGYLWTDGVEIRTLSGPIQSEFLEATASGAYPIRAGRLANNYVLVVAVGLRAWLLHVPTGRWMRLSADDAITTPGRFIVAAHTLTYPFAVGAMSTDKSLWLLDELVVPEIALESNRGKDARGATTKRIPAQWQSRLVNLSSPVHASALRRVLLDYSFYLDGAVAEGSGWFVSLLDGQGNTLLAETQVASQLDPPTQIKRKRAQFDVFAEATDVQLRVAWQDDGSGTAPAVVKAEIYDATIEFDAAQRRANL